MEKQPVQFFVRDLETLWDEARQDLARFVGARPEDLVFVPNATTGVNTVLRSLLFQPGDELLVTDQEYNACRNALDFVAERSGARIVVAHIPFPQGPEADFVSLISEKLSPRTRLVLVDHVTSQTGLVFPVHALAKVLESRGIELLVDGAHAPGMLPLNLRELGATYYTGNCHKWICAPKGAGFLHVQTQAQGAIRPLIISHGANSPRQDRARFLIEFGWTGTWDASAYLAVPEALRFLQSLLPGGWRTIMQRNRALALAGREILCKALGIAVPCPAERIGSLASIPLHPATDTAPPSSPLYADPLQDRLREEFHIEVPVIPWPAPPQRVLRISAQLYNSLPQYERLAEALVHLGMAE
jgi:isopenicillin-N epimerase